MSYNIVLRCTGMLMGLGNTLIGRVFGAPPKHKQNERQTHQPVHRSSSGCSEAFSLPFRLRIVRTPNTPPSTSTAAQNTNANR